MFSTSTRVAHTAARLRKLARLARKTILKLIVCDCLPSLVRLVLVGGAGFATQVGDVSLVLVHAMETDLAFLGGGHKFFSDCTILAVVGRVVLGSNLGAVHNVPSIASKTRCIASVVGALVGPSSAHLAFFRCAHKFFSKRAILAVVHGIVLCSVLAVVQNVCTEAILALDGRIEMGNGLVLATGTNGTI